MHDNLEWVGTLRAALDATDRFTIVELGAGWAPWLVAGHKLAQLRGINETHLVGVEGSGEHIEFMRQNFLDNGLVPGAHQLIHGVVGIEDGVAYFPDLVQPGEDYGAAADYSGSRGHSGMVAVKCYSLETILRDLPPQVDIVHCDIQGSEADVMEASLDLLDKRVRRVVIGTHSRLVEGRLLEMFSARGWRLEHEMVCIYRQEPATGVLALLQDGAQVWRNIRV